MNQIVIAAFTYASTLILLTEAFSLTYKSTKVPNFALGTIMTTGAYAAYSSKKFLNIPVYFCCPIAFLSGALLMFIISSIIIEPLFKKGRTLVEITLATIGFEIILTGLIQIYDKYIQNPRTNIFLRAYDFRIGEIYGSFPVSSLIAFASFLLLRHILESTRFGLAVKASCDNFQLAQVQGINTIRDRILLWTLAGGLAGLSGGIMVMRFHVTPSSGHGIMMAIFAASFLGGIDSVRGAIIGGFFVGLAEIMIITWCQMIIGVWFGGFRFLIPFSIIVIVLGFAPNGLFGTDVQKGKGFVLTPSRKRFIGLILVILIFTGSLFVYECNRKKSKLRDSVFSELSDYDLVIDEMERDVPRFSVGNFSIFLKNLDKWNITTVYVEPYSDSSSNLVFYYILFEKYYKTSVFFEYYGICKYRIG